MIRALEKHCPRCNTTKLRCDFGIDNNRYDGLKYCCKPCAVQRNTAASAEYYCRKRADRLVNQARLRANKSGIPYDLDAHRPAIRARFDKGHCEMTGIPFVIQNGRSAYGPSIDRIDPKKGYVYTNIRIVLDIMNVAMNAFGEETLRDVMSEWLKRKRDG